MTNTNAFKVHGHIIAFTRDGAVEAYRTFAKRCYNPLTFESSVALSAMSDALREYTGMTPDEVEAIEIEVLEGMSK